MPSGLRKIMFFILMLGVSYAGYQYMIRPANENLAQHRAAVKTKMAKLAEFEKATVATKSLSRELEQLQEVIESIEDKLPPTSEIHKVLEKVTVIAQAQGLTAKTIRTLKKKYNGGYVEQPLKMALTGDFDSFYSFLLELERLPRIIKVRELNLKKEVGQEGQVSANFVVSIFFQNKPFS